MSAPRRNGPDWLFKLDANTYTHQRPRPPRPGSPDLLLDAKHRRWFVVTLLLAAGAVALHLWLGRDVPGGLRGGSAVGLWYGVTGSLLMAFAGLLSAHRRLPVRRWVGRRQAWLRGHVWLGLLAVVFILCHSGYSLGGPLEVALWLALGVTTLSGVVALAAQAVLPNLITRRVEAETPYEQLPHVCDVMRRDADEAAEAALAKVEGPAGAELRGLHQVVRAFLASDFDPRSPLAEPLRAEQVFDQAGRHAGLAGAAGELARLRGLCDERRQMGEQARLHRWLHVWLLIHVPVTAALLVLAAAHAVMSVYW
ncbi:MAG: hypothetical protein U0797_23975 [Gemmataceae bacterium]